MLQCKTKWKKEQLKNILEDSYAGGTPNRSRYDFYGGNIPWVTSGEVNQSVIIETNEYITDLGYKNSSAKMIPKNTVLLAMYGATAGQVSMLKIPATSNQAVLAIIPCKELDKNYLYHNLRYFKERILFSAQGSGQTNLSKELVEKYKITFPTNIEEQSKIADILSTCDDVIEKTEETIEKYKQIKAGMMQDLFTRGLDENGKLRPAYQKSPEIYKYSKELDRFIPKEWAVDKLESDNVAIINPTCGKLPDEFIYIDLESVINGNLEQTKIISRIGAPSRAQRLVENYDILYQTVRPYQKNNYLYNQTTNMRSVASTGYAQIRTILNPLFLYQYLHTDLFVNKVLSHCTGTSYPAINPTNLGKIYIPIPKDGEQKIIANLFRTLDIKINKENEVLSKYKQIKQGLMKKLLTPPADAEIVEE